MRFFYICIFLSNFLFPLLYAATGGGNRCSNAFVGSRLYFENKAVTSNKASRLFPDFVNPVRERELQKSWNEEPDTPFLLQALLPQDAHFIKYQQYQPGSPTAVKLEQPGSTLMVRAHYKYDGRVFHTNVAFSVRALWSNMLSTGEKNWFVGEDARAAILFLHGGGTKSSGAHVGSPIINHFRNHNIDVVSLDLPWHAGGHREFLNFETEIKVLGRFVQKYIPPHVPLFVMGHSWGSLFAEQLMMMTDRPHSEFWPHKNLKGVIILSTAVDAAPGKSTWEKKDAFARRTEDVKNNRQNEVADSEQDLWKTIVEEGKVNPLGGFYSMGTILQLDQVLPAHKGKKWVKALMVVGKYDPLVYVGFEDLYEYYKQLENTETHYLDRLPYYTDKKGPPQKVGHLLSDFLDSSGAMEIRYVLVHEFINKQLQGSSAPVDKNNNNPGRREKMPDFLRLMQNFANDLAFREFLKDYIHIDQQKKPAYLEYVGPRKHEINNKISDALYPYSSPRRRVWHFLKRLASLKSNVNPEKWEKDYMKEIEYITQPPFLKSLTHYRLGQNLLELHSLMQDFNIHGIPINIHNMIDIQQKTQQITSEYGSVLYTPKSRSNSKTREPSMVRRVLSSRSLDEAVQRMSSEELPDQVINEVIALIEQSFVINDIIRGTYVPTREMIEKIGIRPGKDARVYDVLEKLSNVSSERGNLLISMKRLVSRIRDLVTEHKKLLFEVKRNIKIIRQYLEQAPSQPPVSLANNYDISTKEFQKVLEAHVAMEQVLDQLSAGFFEKDSSLSTSEVNSYLIANREKIDNFVILYTRYVQNRNKLRKKVINSIENGEMGEKAKKAVISIYGYNSNGERPRIGSDNIYTHLEEVIKELARAEAEKQRITRLLIEGGMLYNSLMNTLRELVKVNGSNNKAEKDLLEDVSNMVTVSNILLDDILRDRGYLDANASPKPKAIERINNFDDVFSAAINHWNSLKSSQPPALPTFSE